MNPIDQTYLDLYDTICVDGTREPNRTGVDTISLFGVSYRMPVSAAEFPILTHKKIHWRSIVAELIWYLSGEPHIRNLQQHTNIWNQWAKTNGELESAYGRYWRHYPVGNSYGDCLLPCEPQHPATHYFPDKAIETPALSCFDQLRWIVDELKVNPRSRRLHVTAWYPPNATASKLPPCHHSFTLNYQARKLNLHLTQRSSDHCLGNPFNFSCYSLLLLLICREVKLEPGEFFHSITDAHIYVNHLEPVAQGSRDTYPAPSLDLSKLENKSLFDLDYGDIDKIKLVNYQHGPFIKLDVAV
jgi:thymidylate synthase